MAMSWEDFFNRMMEREEQPEGFWPNLAGVITTMLARQEKAGREFPQAYGAMPLYGGAFQWMQPQLSDLLGRMRGMEFGVAPDIESIREYAGISPMEDITEAGVRRGVEEAWEGIPEAISRAATEAYLQKAPPEQAARSGLAARVIGGEAEKAMAPYFVEKTRQLAASPEMARKYQLARYGAQLTPLLEAGKLSTALDQMRQQQLMGELAGLKTGVEAQRMAPLRYEKGEESESWLGSLLAGLGGTKGLGKLFGKAGGWLSKLFDLGGGGRTIPYSYPWTSEPEGYNEWTAGAPT